MQTYGGRVSPGERTRRLSPHECKAWLCSHHEGRLGDIVHYAPGSEVSLDVDGGTPAAHRETVVVTGEAALADSGHKPLIDQTAFQEEWPPDVPTSIICVPLTAIEGFELREQ
ncbi:MAG: hypothetical protein K0R13_990 [Propionibacteriaceae bacterium]|nr:hypothetical protein [Propionibacteriaceae bacterium]